MAAPGSDGALYFRHILDACAFFGIAPPAGASTATAMLLSVAARGGKPGASGDADAGWFGTSWRPYYVVVCGTPDTPEGERLVLVGKLMETLVSTHYRGTLFRASECEVRPDRNDGRLLHILRARPPPGERPHHVILQAASVGERDGILARLIGVLPAPVNQPIGGAADAGGAAARLRPHAARLQRHGGSAAPAGLSELTTDRSSNAVAVSASPAMLASAAASISGSAVLSLGDRLREIEERVRGRSHKQEATPLPPGSVVRRVDVDRLPPMPPRTDAFAQGDADARHRYAVYSEIMSSEVAYVRKMQVGLEILASSVVSGCARQSCQLSFTPPVNILSCFHLSHRCLLTKLWHLCCGEAVEAEVTIQGVLGEIAPHFWFIHPVPRCRPPCSGDEADAASPVINPDLVLQIFGIAEALTEVNAAFLADLSSAFSSGTRLSVAVAASFQQFLPFFKM